MRSRGYLPHLEKERAIYFVTFRLADSLPQALLEQLAKEREVIEKAKRAKTTAPADERRLTDLRKLLRKAERLLDGGLGHCHLRDARVGQIVADALRRFDGEKYELFAWCVMPNHVHVLFAPLVRHQLGAILHSWKSFSAQEANRILGRTGRFWQREYFDHLVRNEASLRRIVEYVKENPKRAGLQNWPWVGSTL